MPRKQTPPRNPRPDPAGKSGETGRFLPGNRFWEARSSHGPNPKFGGPEELWAACLEYFGWVADNPLYEDNLVTFQGQATHEPTAKLRAMSIEGLCNFLDVTDQTWRDWREGRPDLLGVITRAERVMRQQKFEGASAGLLVPNIIARDLGLADRQEHTGRDGGPIRTEDMTARDLLADRIARLAARVGAPGNSDEPDGDAG